MILKNTGLYLDKVVALTAVSFNKWLVNIKTSQDIQFCSP